jgi:hypothetical protein
MELVGYVFCLDSLEFLVDKLDQWPVAPEFFEVRFWPLAAPEMSIFLLVRTSAFGNSRHPEIDLIAHCLYGRPLSYYK